MTLLIVLFSLLYIPLVGGILYGVSLPKEQPKDLELRKIPKQPIETFRMGVYR